MESKIESRTDLRKEVRRAYAKIALNEPSVDEECSPLGCCSAERSSATAADQLGYSAKEIAVLPEGADLGLGCGNPQAIASLKAGETVLDLGSGAGFDCFLVTKAGCGRLRAARFSWSRPL